MAGRLFPLENASDAVSPLLFSDRQLINMNHLILTVLLTCLGAIRFAEADVCNPNPCRNGGTCQPPDKGYNWGYFCRCQAGFVGAQCQWDNDQCKADTRTPCQNNGRCAVTQDGRFCMCPGDTEKTVRYGGHYCELDNPCRSCPTGTVYCHSAPTMASGCLCLNDKHMEIV